MLCTKGRPGLLPLMIYAGDKLLEPRHVLEVATRFVSMTAAAPSHNQWKGVGGSLGPSCRFYMPLRWRIQPALISPARIFSFLQ